MISFSWINKKSEMCGNIVLTFQMFFCFHHEATDRQNQILKKQFASESRWRKRKEKQKKLTYQRFRLSCGFTHNILDKHISFSLPPIQSQPSPHMNILMSGYYYSMASPDSDSRNQQFIWFLYGKVYAPVKWTRRRALVMCRLQEILLFAPWR